MNTLHILFFVINTICIVSFHDAAPSVTNEKKLIIRGRVTFPGGSRIPVESNATLTVELQDTSLADAAAKVIARGTGTANRFPMAFAIRYPLSQVTNGISYSLSVTIRNKKNELLYINNVYTAITPLGVNRTKFIDVPVISVKAPTPVSDKTQWPELVGTKGEDAVKIIKQETGFTNVVTVNEGSPITMDYRTDRVRIVIDSNGIVKNVPSIG